MKAYVLEDVDKLEYKDVAIPECPEGWALVAVKASGICSSDIPRIFIKGTYHFPTIPGHEYSGQVIEVGCEKDKTWIGKRVGVFPLIPCRKCEQCKQKKYELCSDYDYTGSRRDGGFSEVVAVPVWNLIEIPDSISYEHAAMFEPLAVALHAVKKSELKAGDSLAVIGTGMIGIAIAQWAKSFGAENVFVIGRNEGKRGLVEKIPGIKYSSDISALKLFDKVIEAVGTSESIQKAIELTRPEGTLVLMGNPAGDILLDQANYWKILRKQLIVKGTWNSSFNGKEKSDWTEVVDALQSGSVDVSKLISHHLNKEQLLEGLHLMKEHKEPYCKVMINWE